MDLSTVYLEVTNTQKLQDKNRIKLKSPEHSETRFVPLEFESEQIPLEGKAGTLIIFDTDVFHRAGKVERRTICHAGTF